MNEGSTIVLTLRQPWANMLMYIGKSQEIRTMNTNIRGRIAIRSSLTKPLKRDLDWLEEYGLNVMFADNWYDDMDSFKRGVILGTISLTGCTKIESKEHFRSTVDAHLNNPDCYKDGLYAWEMKEPHLLTTPIEYTPLRGAIVWSHRKGVIA